MAKKASRTVVFRPTQARVTVGKKEDIRTVSDPPTCFSDEDKQLIPARLRLLDDRVLICCDEPVKKTPGGILLPDTSRERPQRGTVTRVGPGKLRPGTDERVPLPVKEGDRVLFMHYAGATIPDFPNHLLLRIDDVLAVVDD